MNILKEYKIKNNLTNAALASMLNCSLSTIYNNITNDVVSIKITNKLNKVINDSPKLDPSTERKLILTRQLKQKITSILDESKKNILVNNLSTDELIDFLSVIQKIEKSLDF